MDQERFHRIGKALADSRRMEILEQIAALGEAPCAELMDGLVSQPTISHHLKELANAGLITARREGKFTFYQFEKRTWAQYLAELRRRIPATKKRRN